MGNARDVLAFWDSLLPKLKQLVRQETKSAVRKKKMNLSAIDTTTQTVTVYEASNPTATITVPYRGGAGIERLTAGQSVVVEWIYGDLSTATAVSCGSGWNQDPSSAAPTYSIGTSTASRLDRSGNVVVFYVNVDITSAMSTGWTTIGTLPEGYRPMDNTRGICMVASGSVPIQTLVTASGNIRVYLTTANTEGNTVSIRGQMTYIIP